MLLGALCHTCKVFLIDSAELMLSILSCTLASSFLLLEALVISYFLCGLSFRQVFLEIWHGNKNQFLVVKIQTVVSSKLLMFSQVKSLHIYLYIFALVLRSFKHGLAFL